jgi:signal transduction histidine kinase
MNRNFVITATGMASDAAVGIRRQRERVQKWFEERLNQKQTLRLVESQGEVAATVPAGGSLTSRLGFLRSVINEGRAILHRFRSTGCASATIEQELSGFLRGLSTGTVRCEVCITGHSREFRPAIREQINLIVQEALLNALRHSEATRIEAEVEYSTRRLRVVVRDNGRGIEPCQVQSRTVSNWGLAGMRKQAERIGAQLTIWSRPGAGTEVEISIPNQVLTDACA